MNEPDFVVNEWTDLSRRVRRPLPFAVLADLVARFSDLVHARSAAMTTLGGARVRNLEAWMDARTGLWNARHFEELFAGEFSRARRFKRPLTVLMADLDLLREVNNVHGHQAGDCVLQGIGALIQQTIRDYDIAARVGGEEFAIVLPETGREPAWALAERLRARVGAHTFETATAGALHVTVSIGVACFPADGGDTVQLIAAADEALYAAKRGGRNRVVLNPSCYLE